MAPTGAAQAAAALFVRLMVIDISASLVVGRNTMTYLSDHVGADLIVALGKQLRSLQKAVQKAVHSRRTLEGVRGNCHQRISPLD
jgi:hypothetical protein